MTRLAEDPETAWCSGPAIWGGIGILIFLAGLTFRDALQELWRLWGMSDEFSYGYIIPPLVVFLIWQKKDTLERLPFTGSWLGVLLTFVGIFLFLIGDLSTIYVLVQYGFVFVLAGAALALMGRHGFRAIGLPMALLLFMIPLPQFFLKTISQELQLFSSEIGVAVIRLFGISVFLEGNVIDLGAMKLQVVEACSGLRYLFPLMTLGFIAAYFFKAPLWQRAVVFLSTIPITVLMNSLRIGIIGVLVEHWGPSQTEGFLHDFEGWVVFMACTGVLIGEMWLLNHFVGGRLPWREAFGLELPTATPGAKPACRRSLPPSYFGVIALAVLGAALSLILPHRVESAPARSDFATFPLRVGEWEGVGDRIEQIYLDELKLDDYLLVNYRRVSEPLVNLYVAYYGSQRKGESAHSPKTCMPGGGWRISSFEAAVVDRVPRGVRLPVNRAIIEHGEQKQLVYYWFQQRGRIITNEYLVKWFIFWDALTRNRSDGAMVRLVTPLLSGEDMNHADARLSSFVREVAPLLERYVPN